MKKFIILAISLFMSFNAYSQLNTDIRVPLLGEKAPSFKAISTQGEITFPPDNINKWKILFSHPADFTPVCTSEIWELASMQNDFSELNAKIYVISTDGLNSHIQWVKSIESIEYKNNKPSKIKFPLISDSDLKVSKLYGMLHPYTSSTQNVRGIFIIDPDNYIRFIAFYPNNIGRNIDEIKRVLVALQETNSHRTLTPVNWKQGDDVLIHSPASIEESDKMITNNDPDYYSYTWYMWFKKMNK